MKIYARLLVLFCLFGLVPGALMYVQAQILEEMHPWSYNQSGDKVTPSLVIPTLTNGEDEGTSLDCHNNVNCLPWIQNWCNEIRSVVKIRFREGPEEEWNSCSGGIINTESGEPLILTARHCVESGYMPEEWEVYL